MLCGGPEFSCLKSHALFQPDLQTQFQCLFCYTQQVLPSLLSMEELLTQRINSISISSLTKIFVGVMKEGEKRKITEEKTRFEDGITIKAKKVSNLGSWRNEMEIRSSTNC